VVAQAFRLRRWILSRHLRSRSMEIVRTFNMRRGGLIAGAVDGVAVYLCSSAASRPHPACQRRTGSGIEAKILSRRRSAHRTRHGAVRDGPLPPWAGCQFRRYPISSDICNRRVKSVNTTEMELRAWKAQLRSTRSSRHAHQPGFTTVVDAVRTPE